MAASIVGTYNTAGTALRVAKSGNYAYIADYEGGVGNDSLVSIDVSDVTNPTLADSLNTGRTYDVCVSSGYVYTVGHNGNGRIVDISVTGSPTNLTQVGQMTGGSSLQGVFVSGNYAYVADYGAATNSFLVFDITTKTGNRASSASANVANANKIYVSGNYAYVVNTSAGAYGMTIIDITDPLTPVIKSTYPVGSADCRDVFVTGGYAYLCYGTLHKMDIVNVSDPTSPSLVGTVDTIGSAYGVYVYGSYAFVAANTTGLQVIDISDKATPSVVDTVDTNAANGITISGNYAYVADGSAGLVIIDVDDYIPDPEVSVGYKIRIGEYPGTLNTDYFEFSSDADPVPSFGQGRTNIYNELGEIIRIEYILPFVMYFPAEEDVDNLWTKWDRCVSMLENSVQDIRIYYDDTPKREYVLGGTTSGTQVGCIRSPRILSLNPQVSRGSLVSFMQFDMSVFIQTGFSTHGTSIVDLNRTITETTQNGVLTKEGNITAKGPGALARVQAFKGEVGEDSEINFEQIVQQVDNDTYVATYRIERPSGGGSSLSSDTVSVSETITVMPGGRDKKFELITGDNDPIEFDGPRKPYVVSIVGTTVAKSREGLRVPDRSGLSGYVSGEYDFSIKSSQTPNTDGTPKDWEGTYTQVFKLPNRNGVDNIISNVNTLINPVPGNALDEIVGGIINA